MTVDAVLGLGCLKAKKGIINLQDRTMSLGDESHLLECDGRIPSKTEIVTNGKL